MSWWPLFWLINDSLEDPVITSQCWIASYMMEKYNQYFICTHHNMGLTVIYRYLHHNFSWLNSFYDLLSTRCNSHKMARAHNIYSSDMEDKLIPFFRYCCKSTCCENVVLYEWGNITLNNDERDVYETYRRQNSDYFGSFASPQTWTIVMVAIFALFMLVHNIISSRKRGQVLPLLQEESSGPYSSTRVSEGGVIIPTVVYLEAGPDHHRFSPRTRPAHQLLNALDLFKTIGDKDEKIITEERSGSTSPAIGALTQDDMTVVPLTPAYHSDLTPGSLTCVPLTPAYHPTRQVPRVWAMGHRVEQLYRYTHFDRLVYPPGYVVDRMWCKNIPSEWQIITHPPSKKIKLSRQNIWTMINKKYQL